MKKIKQNKIISYRRKNFSSMLPEVKASSNKYSRGIGIIAAGSTKYPGAAILASRACQRAGAGYTMLYTVASNVSRSAFAMPSCPVDSFSNFKKEKLLKLTKNRPHAILVGSGFIPKSSYNNARLKIALNLLKSSVIIDGGALSCLSNLEIKDLLIKRKINKSITVLTPHMGEAKQILNAYKINSDNWSYKKIAKKINQLTGAIVVLKGPNTHICYSEKYTVINNGGPELAKAGTGDVLAGIILGLLSQNKVKPFKCCALAVYIHAAAGKYYAKKYSSISLVPQDLIECMPYIFKKLNK